MKSTALHAHTQTQTPFTFQNLKALWPKYSWLNFRADWRKPHARTHTYNDTDTHTTTYQQWCRLVSTAPASLFNSFRLKPVCKHTCLSAMARTHTRTHHTHSTKLSSADKYQMRRENKYEWTSQNLWRRPHARVHARTNITFRQLPLISSDLCA